MRKHLIISVLGMLLLASCSETKYVAEGELLLDKVKVKSDVKERTINTTELKSYVRQRGNSRWFSLIKVPLYTYSLSGRDTTRWLNRTLRSIGEPPQIYDSMQTVQSAVRLRDNLQNLGYLRATVDINQWQTLSDSSCHLRYSGYGYCQTAEYCRFHHVGTAKRHEFQCRELGR